MASPPPPPPPEVRRVSGTLIRGYLKTMGRMGLLEPARRVMSPEAAALADKPPFPTTWIGARAHNGVLEAVHQVAGDEGCRELGYENARSSFGQIIVPIVRAILAISGANPASLFSKLDRICAPIIQGKSFEYTPLTPTSGRLEIRSVDRVPRCVYVTWEGALRFAFDMTRVQGTVSPCRISPNGAGAVYDLSWQPGP